MSNVLLWPWLIGLGLTLALESLLRPMVTPFWRRPIATLAVHLGTWSLLFALFVLLLQRPWFAMIFIASLQLVVVQSSNTKWQTLREPFICQDFEYFLDAIRHPRLYVPFFGIGLTIGAIVAGAIAIGAFLVLETSLVARIGPVPFLLGVLTAALLSAIPLGMGLARLPTCSLAAQTDLHQLGLFSSLWAYGRLARQPLSLPDTPPFAGSNVPRPSGDALPHVVAVQSESFFDPRAWCPAIRREVLARYDTMVETAMAHGPLRVPAWGANTVRTEAAFLTGLDEHSLGIHRFNPYHQLVKGSVPSLAESLRSLGYRTICVHPYPASFYGRDKVMPCLGFDEFIDIRAFREEDRCGQFIGDIAVAEKVGKLLDYRDNGPLFIFVITMENHGPLTLDTLAQGDPDGWMKTGSAPLPSDSGELASYLAHLHNADQMTARLRKTLSRSTREGLLCWYGDHVPIMPAAYRHFGLPEGETTHTLWSTQQRHRATRDHVTLDASQLGQRLWQTVLEAACHATDQDVQTQHHQEQA